MNSFSVPISRYGDEPGGGTSELNQVESAVYHREETKKKILELEGNIAELERILHKLDRAIKRNPKEFIGMHIDANLKKHMDGFPKSFYD